jgi:hypothetical protein
MDMSAERIVHRSRGGKEIDDDLDATRPPS